MQHYVAKNNYYMLKTNSTSRTFNISQLKHLRKKYTKISRFFFDFPPKIRRIWYFSHQNGIPGRDIPFIFLKVDTA